MTELGNALFDSIILDELEELDGKHKDLANNVRTLLLQKQNAIEILQNELERYKGFKDDYYYSAGVRNGLRFALKEIADIKPDYE